jgi:hypothetical protein
MKTLICREYRDNCAFSVHQSTQNKGYTIGIQLHPEDNGFILAIHATPKFTTKVISWFNRVNLNKIESHGKYGRYPRQKFPHDVIM